MKRVMIWATALMLMVAGMAVSQEEANAGLFSRKSDCCKPQKCKKPRRAKKCCQPAQCCAPAQAAPVCAAAPAPSCGCQAASNCGCDAAPNCDCLSKRQLRKANRKGECCGAVAKSCSGGEVIIESTPSPAAGEEAAPEAPESTT